MIFVFTLLATFALVLAMHPFVTYPLSLVVLARLRRSPQRPAAAPDVQYHSPAASDRPNIAILLCVHNEAKVIRGRIDNLLMLADTVPGTRILVYTDASTDGTVEILKSYGQRITLVESTERQGKTYGMNLLVTRTNAQLIVFTDAAVRMNTNALTNLIKHFDDPQVGCVCGKIIATVFSDDVRNSTTANTSVKYWAFDAFIRRLESSIASVIGAHGPLFAIRRDLHESVPNELFDDFYLSMAILYNGHRIIQAEDVLGFKAVATRSTDEYTRKIRIACQAFNIHRIQKPRLQQQTWLVRYLYAGHKTLRWLTIFLLAAAALFFTLAFITAKFYSLVIIAWGAFAAFMALGIAGVKPFSFISEAVFLLVATGVGVIQSLRGTVYQTWSSAASARRTESMKTLSRH